MVRIRNLPRFKHGSTILAHKVLHFANGIDASMPGSHSHIVMG